MAALAVVIMCLGGLIPIATYVCPVICTLLLSVVLKRCGKRDAWAWYGAVSVLCLLMAPDKEAAAVFLFLGYYPIVKPVLDRKKCSWIWKGLLFNLSVLAMYWLLIALLGMESTTDSFRGVGYAMLAVMLVMGNVTFFMLDRLLTQVRSIR